jgi:cyanophycinase
MTGVIALVGGGPFEANDDLDARLLADHERVVVMPTADAFEGPEELLVAAESWGARIGVAIEPLRVYTRHDATAEAAAVIDAATAVVLVGDSNIHLRSVLAGTPVFAAIEQLVERGGTVMAVGASASGLCDPMTDRRGGGFAIGLGLVPGLAVITETESWPTEQLQRSHRLAPTAVVDLPTGSALVRSADGWEQVGAAVVHGELPT